MIVNTEMLFHFLCELLLLFNHAKAFLNPVVHTTQASEIGNRRLIFILKMHQMFSIHTTPENFENGMITRHFQFVFEENLGRASHVYCCAIVFQKLRF